MAIRAPSRAAVERAAAGGERDRGLGRHAAGAPQHVGARQRRVTAQVGLQHRGEPPQAVRAVAGPRAAGRRSPRGSSPRRRPASRPRRPPRPAGRRRPGCRRRRARRRRRPGAGGGRAVAVDGGEGSGRRIATCAMPGLLELVALRHVAGPRVEVPGGKLGVQLHLGRPGGPGLPVAAPSRSAPTPRPRCERATAMRPSRAEPSSTTRRQVPTTAPSATATRCSARSSCSSVSSSSGTPCSTQNTAWRSAIAAPRSSPSAVRTVHGSPSRTPVTGAGPRRPGRFERDDGARRFGVVRKGA